MKNITEAKKIENLKSKFVSMVSHELKAPIAAVYGYLKLFSDSSIKLTEEQKLNYINRSQLRVNIQTAEDICSIKADKNEITRLITNLISNAAKYNKENGSIDIQIHKTNKDIFTSVSDTGIGMKPDEKQKLFSELFRAKNEFTKNISGTGLGLSIVKRIVESYSGKIEVESEFGKGTKFKVYFPIGN